MKSIFKTIFSIFVLIFAFVLIGCGETEQVDAGKDNEPTEDVVTKTLNIENVKDVEEGETLTLRCTYDKDVEVSISWQVNDKTLATITQEGVLTAIKSGKVTVTVKDSKSNLEKSCEINITKKAFDQATIDEFLSSLPKQTVANLPQKMGEVNVEYEFDNYISKNGVITRDDDNHEVSGKVVIDGKKYDYTVIIVGEFIDDIAKEFIGQFNNINGDIDIVKRFDDYGGTNITWESDSDIISKFGKFSRPFNDTYVTITYTVVTKNPAARVKYQTKVLAIGETIDYRNKKVEEWINTVAKENSVLYVESVLIHSSTFLLR